MISNRQLFLRYVGQTSDAPMMIEVVRAEGVYQYGPDGKRYLDLISGIGVSNVGHGAPEVVAAVQQQAANFMHSMVYGEFVLSPQVRYARRLAEYLGPGLDHIFFVNSGSEAAEGALKLSKKFTGRQELLAYRDSYHGSTHGALSVTGAPGLKDGYGPFLPGVRFLEFNSGPDLTQITEATAAVIVEPVRGEAGVVAGYPCYLRALRERCTEVGAMLIFDEIQVGFGRTGSLFAHHAYRVRPDILLLGKALGGGMPMGAFVASKEMMQVLTRDPVLGHISTFGGHPVCCAAGLAAFEKLLGEDLLAAIPAKEARIRRLQELPGVREVRGRGMIFAVEVGSFETVLAVIHQCVEAGLITDWFLHCDTAVRIAPPLTISPEELDEGMKCLEACIRAVTESLAEVKH
ncbi:MAG: aspartate aminotransferase family protein [Bacteroidota bacterium]